MTKTYEMARAAYRLAKAKIEKSDFYKAANAADDAESRGSTLASELGVTDERTSYISIQGESYPTKPILTYILRLYDQSIDQADFSTTQAHRLAENSGFSRIPVTPKEVAIYLERERETYQRLVRPEQPKFRAEAMRIYNRKCAVTGCSIYKVLDACHIHEVCEGGIDVASNSIILRPDIHRLFDCGLIAIDPDSFKICREQWVDEKLGFSFSKAYIPTIVKEGPYLRARFESWVTNYKMSG